MKKESITFKPHGSPYHLDDRPSEEEEELLDSFERKYPHLSEFLKNRKRYEKTKMSKV